MGALALSRLGPISAVRETPASVSSTKNLSSLNSTSRASDRPDFPARRVHLSKLLRDALDDDAIAVRGEGFLPLAPTGRSVLEWSGGKNQGWNLPFKARGKLGGTHEADRSGRSWPATRLHRLWPPSAEGVLARRCPSRRESLLELRRGLGILETGGRRQKRGSRRDHLQHGCGVPGFVCGVRLRIWFPCRRLAPATIVR